MLCRYKIIIASNNLYKEIEIPISCKQLQIGTTTDCDVRLKKELFFSSIDITFKKNNDNWNVTCSDNLYFTVGDVRKLLTKKLKHGDELFVKYQDSDNDVFSFSFVIDFDYETKDYDLEIDINNMSSIKIGGTTDSDLKCSDAFLGSDFMILQNNNGQLQVIDNNSKYGVFVNGVKINKSKQINSCDFFSIVGFSFYYKSGKIYTNSNKKIKINNLQYRKTQRHSTHFKYPKFNRNSRIKYLISEDELEVQTAPNPPRKPTKSLLMSLIPALIMLALTIVLRGIMGSGGTFVIYSAISMTVGITTSVITYFQDKKKFESEWSERIEEYNKYIEAKEVEIQTSRDNELRIRNLIYECLENDIQESYLFGKRLFEKEKEDVDFLQVYLGKGTIESSNKVKFTKKEFIELSDPLAPIPEQISDKYKYIENAPIISDFNASCGVGIVGDDDHIKQTLKNLTLDIAIRHFYGDVKLVYVFGDGNINNMQWARWLHNVENERLNIRNIACDEESQNIILEDLYAILSFRQEQGEQEDGATYDEQYVVFITNSASVVNHPVSKYFKICNKYGFTFVFLDNYEENLPRGCTEIIRLKNDESGMILNTSNGDSVLGFSYPKISDAVAQSVALKLGGVYVDEVSLEGELTKNISMFDMLGILSIDDLNLLERWNQAQVYKSLAAPLGVKRKNKIVYLDIGDGSKAHGPHGLVAGTTGSGKSEVLQTYILSMATLYHPYEVGFVIIDFKGGGMANQFSELPHLIGTITNIDGREINRSLLSIKAELIKRQEMFSDSGVNHINDYIKLYKANKVSVPMPHLIMIVDEFAELKAEYPDFMKELISAARIGRTLGIHLILATQKPSGVVDAQIWSNSKFKLCLKVQTKEDSNEVIKTPLAAEIVEPGRAYLQVGNNEIFDLFQSAYCGANVPDGNESNDKIFSIYEMNLWGKKQLKYTNKKKKSNENSTTQLQSIVDHVNELCLNNGIEKLPGICLPSLPNKISTDDLDYVGSKSNNIVVPIGYYDDPEQQRQNTVLVEPSKENVYIVGSSQTGKTIMLQTIAYGLINKYSPSQVNIYMIDCGSMVLKIFDNSSHVGGVVLASEEEKCKNLFKLLNKTLATRKKVLSDKGISNYAAYLEAGYDDMPMIVVMIDNVAAFKEYFPNHVDTLTSLSREAQGVGVSLIVTAAMSNALNYRTQANFAKKYTLNCIDAGEYTNVFGRCKIVPKDNPGSGLLMIDKRVVEFQTAIFGNSKKEAERSAEFIKLMKQRNSNFKEKAIMIPMIPENLILEEEMSKMPQVFRQAGKIPIGMTFDDIEYKFIDLIEGGSLAVSGNSESRAKFVSNFIQIISKTAIFHNVQAVVIDDKQKPLAKCENYGFVKTYSSDTLDSISLICDFSKMVADKFGTEREDGTIDMLIINSNDVMRKLNADKKEAKVLADAIKNAADAGAFILINNVENQAIGFNSSEILKAIRDERKAIMLTKLEDVKIFEVSIRARTEGIFDDSVGYYFSGNNCIKIKIFN